MEAKIVLKDEQGKIVGSVPTIEEANELAWTIRGQGYTNPVIVFFQAGRRVGQYPPRP